MQLASRHVLWMLLLPLGIAPATAGLKECTVGLHVVDQAGLGGTITGFDQGTNQCTLTMDDGQEDYRMPYVLRPAPGGGAAAAGSNAIADGEYQCDISTGSFTNHNVVQMGRFDIRGKTYRFRPMGGVTNGFAPYEIGSDGSITWGGPMGALNTPPAQVLDSAVDGDGFHVRFVIEDGADAETMSCHPL